MESHVTVALTGAAGQIAYALIPYLLNGTIFGLSTNIHLRLLDITAMMTPLTGVKMEIEDCAYPLLKDLIITDDANIAFKDADIVVMAGAMPRKEGMERSELLKANVAIFKTQGEALNNFARKTCKVLVVGNPANTNAYVVSHYAPTIPRVNFTALTRLDQNRCQGLLSRTLNVPLKAVTKCIIWGNHSSTQCPVKDKWW